MFAVTYFVLRARSEVGDTLFGTMSKGFTTPFKDFPVRKKKPNSTYQKSTSNKTSKAQYKCPTALSLCLSQRKIGVFLIGIDFVCLIKG